VAEGRPALAVRLGATHPEDGIAPAFAALLERGVARSPESAMGLRGEVELRFQEGYEPVRIAFEAAGVLVEDGPADAPEVVIEARLPELVQLATAPTTFGGLPNPLDPRGRTAIGRLARGQIRVTGSRAMGRRLLALLAF